MLKALRKYKQWVLADGGTLLMISFLAPQAVTQMRGDPRKEVVATLGTEKVRAGDLQKAAMEFKALEDFDDGLLRAMNVENAEHWYLLAKEAERAGLVGEHGDGETFLPLRAKELAPRIVAEEQLSGFLRQNPDLLRSIDPRMLQSFAEQMAVQELQDPEKRRKAEENALAMLVARMHRGQGETRLNDTEFYQAVAKVRGVLRLLNTYAGAARISDRLAITETSARADTVFTDLVVVPAERGLADIPEPTDEELNANYEKYRDVQPGQGEDGIGYRQPDRVKLEWLRLDRAAFEAAVTVDPVEVRKRQTLDRAKDPQGFAAERARIEADLKNTQVGQLLSEADKIIGSQVRAQTRKLETDGDFKKLPADWAAHRANLESIAQKVVEGLKTTRNVTIPLPAVSSKATWLTQQEIAGLEGIGSASLHLGPRSVSVAQAVMDIKELDGKGAGLGLQTQLLQIEPAATDAAGNRYYFTVLDAKKASAADSLDEVRADVAKNVKLLKAFERLKAGADQYKELAGTGGLESVAKLFPGEMQAVTPEQPNPPPISPLPVRKAVRVQRDAIEPDDPVLNTELFRNAAREVGLKLDPLTAAETLPVDQRTYAVALPRDKSLVVGVVIGHRPMTDEQFRQLALRDVERMSMDSLRVAAEPNSLLSPFAYKPLSERMQFKYKHKDE